MERTKQTRKNSISCVAMCFLKQHKMRISGMDTQYTFHLRSLSARQTSKCHSWRKNSCHTSCSSFPLRMHSVFIPFFYISTILLWAVILISYNQVLIQQNALNHDNTIYLVCVMLKPYPFLLFPIQSSPHEKSRAPQLIATILMGLQLHLP